MSDKRAALQTIIGKLAKLIPLLASDKPAEVLNAVQAIRNLLASAGTRSSRSGDARSLGRRSPLLSFCARCSRRMTTSCCASGVPGLRSSTSQQGATFADVIVREHRVTWQLTSPEFEEWLVHQFFLERRRAPTPSAMRNAIRSLSAQAKFEGDQHDVHLRAANSGGRIYLDLVDEQWRAVEIDKVDWRVVEPPVRFRRTATMRPLPLPQRGGSINQLRRFVEV